jgi:HSP20 family protein
MAGKYASSLLFASRFQAEINRLFQEVLAATENEIPAGEWQPPIDIVETPESVLVVIEVPGLAPDDLKVEVRGMQVMLSGTKSTPLPEAQHVKFQRVERGHGRFRREIQLFWPVNSHLGTASLADGVLTLTFPKINEKRQAARRLHIEEGGETPE